MSEDEFSRPAVSSPLGKCDQRLDIPVPEALLEGVIGLAALHGMSKAEYARQVLERHVFGELSMLRRMASRGPVRNGSNEG